MEPAVHHQGQGRHRARQTEGPICETCSLDCARAGDRFEIVSVDDSDARVHALRFGMAEGSSLECITRIPAGPLVVRSGRQEIAIGRELAKRIQVLNHGGHRERWGRGGGRRSRRGWMVGRS